MFIGGGNPSGLGDELNFNAGFNPGNNGNGLAGSLTNEQLQNTQLLQQLFQNPQ